MKTIEYYIEQIDERKKLTKPSKLNNNYRVIEEWCFKEFIREIISKNTLSNMSDKEVIKEYKKLNKKWKHLSIIFPKIIHPKTFVKNVRRNINGEFFSWRWWFV